jgi:hypothetical protein
VGSFKSFCSTCIRSCSLCQCHLANRVGRRKTSHPRKLSEPDDAQRQFCLRLDGDGTSWGSATIIFSCFIALHCWSYLHPLQLECLWILWEAQRWSTVAYVYWFMDTTLEKSTIIALVALTGTLAASFGLFIALEALVSWIGGNPVVNTSIVVFCISYLA